MMIFCYPSKKAIVENIGKPLEYIETSFFGEEYVADGKIIGCNRPFSPEYGRANVRCFNGVKKDGTPKKATEYFATVTMKGGLIEKVE